MSDGTSATAPAPHPAPGGDALQHIHGLGVTAGTLYIATHTGLWSLPVRGGSPKLVGKTRQDLMGFSVTRRGSFVASGHPAPNQKSLPPNLGLIRSTDRGHTWEPASLLGEADFHVLESAGPRVYGFDGSRGRLLVSANGGRTWQQRSPPATVFDLAVDPTEPRRVVASTEVGLVASVDGGVDWLQLRDDVAGLIAWPRHDRFYLVAGDGTVAHSRDGGRRWTAVGTLGGEPVALTARGRSLYAALADNSVKRSTDGGRTWTVRVAAR